MAICVGIQYLQSVDDIYLELESTFALQEDAVTVTNQKAYQTEQTTNKMKDNQRINPDIPYQYLFFSAKSKLVLHVILPICLQIQDT